MDVPELVPVALTASLKVRSNQAITFTGRMYHFGLGHRCYRQHDQRTFRIRPRSE